MPSKIFGFREAKGAKPFRVENKSATKAEIIIYDQIGDSWFSPGVTAKSFDEELKKLEPTVNEITVRINSPGGDVFDGVTIYNRLKQHKAKIIVYIDGLAASIASIIALAGDEVIIGEGALYMIHLPWTFSMGNRMDLENTVNRLMDVEEQLISIYQRKTKLDRAEIRKMLEDETWLDAEQAIEKGFVDKKVEEALPIAASVFENQWIKKTPKTYKSETKVVASEIEKLKQKIGAHLARK